MRSVFPPGRLRASIALVLSALVALTVALDQARPTRAGATPAFAPGYTGTNWYAPDEGASGCPRWTWLTGCYTKNPQGGPSAQSILRGDAAWIAQQHLGTFQRVWAMLPQGIQWWSDGSYAGLDSTYLANLDDALSAFHQHGIQVDLVVYEASQGTTDQNQFQVQALDGQHPQLRAGYLQALRDLVAHLAANQTDAATVAVADLMNEAYFALGKFGVSDGIIHQWLRDAYAAAHAAAPGFPYTVSDTERLVRDYQTWGPLYDDAVDVYDIHGYSDRPWDDAALWQQARAFRRPWFVGEAGCAPGHISCTYDGTAQCAQPEACALSVDGWFLANLKADGARAVLIENGSTAGAEADGAGRRAVTRVGQVLQRAVLAQG